MKTTNQILKLPDVKYEYIINTVAEVEPSDDNENYKNEDIAVEASAWSSHADWLNALWTAICWLKKHPKCSISHVPNYT